MSNVNIRQYFCTFRCLKLLGVINDFPHCSHDNGYTIVWVFRWYFRHCPQVETWTSPDHMHQNMNYHTFTKKLLLFCMCTNEPNSQNVLSHCLQATSFYPIKSSHISLYILYYIILYMRNSILTMFTSNGLLLFALVWSLNHLLQYVICNLDWWKMVSPLYDFWSGFIDCLLDQTICSTVYKARVTLVSILICLLIGTIFIQFPRWGTLTGKL